MSSQSASHPAPYVVVVGIDFSDAAAKALEEAVNLAEHRPAAELHLVHVVPDSVRAASVGTTEPPELAYLTQIQDSGEILRRWLEPFRQSHIQLGGHVRVGRADREIAQLASDLGADLVVVAAESKGGLERFLLGSVAKSLMRHAPCAVLAYRPRAVPAWQLIEPPCTDCVRVREETSRARLWCQRHSEHHARAHTYHQVPDSFGMGSQTFRA